MIRLRPQVCYALGQMPTDGRIVMSSGASMDFPEECDSAEGQLFDQQNLCCKFIAVPTDHYWYCTKTTFGNAAPSPIPSEAAPASIPTPSATTTTTKVNYSPLSPTPTSSAPGLQIPGQFPGQPGQPGMPGAMTTASMTSGMSTTTMLLLGGAVLLLVFALKK